jgi:hypothetical protein
VSGGNVGPHFQNYEWLTIIYSSVGIATGYGLDNRDSSVRFKAGAGNFSLHHRVQNGSATHTSSYPVGNGGYSLGVKWAERESDQSPPSSTEVKTCEELHLHTPQYVFMAWCLVKHRDNFNFTLILQQLMFIWHLCVASRVPKQDAQNFYQNYYSERLTLCLRHSRLYPKVSGLAAWSENCKWYSSRKEISVRQYGLDSSGSGCGPVTGSCKHGNEPSRPIKRRKVTD